VALSRIGIPLRSSGSVASRSERYSCVARYSRLDFDFQYPFFPANCIRDCPRIDSGSRFLLPFLFRSAGPS